MFSDTITREVDVMGSPFLSLEESKAEWAKTAVRAAGRYKDNGKARRSFGKELAEHGFDIRVEAERLERNVCWNDVRHTEYKRHKYEEIIYDKEKCFRFPEY